MKQLQTEKDYQTATRFFGLNKEHLARYLYDRCYIVILRDNVLGIFPNWEYNIEDIRGVYKTNAFKNELIILSPMKLLVENKNKIEGFWSKVWKKIFG